MPTTKSAKKRLRTSQQAHELNAAARTRVKNARRTFIEKIAGDDAKASTEAYREYCSVLDMAAKRGVIKKNTAVRRKHRAAEKIRAMA